MAQDNLNLPAESTQLKICLGCGPRPITDFYLKRGKPRSRCKTCHYEKSKPSTKAYQKRQSVKPRAPLIGKYRKLPDLSESDKARFWTSVQILGPEECWPWMGDTFDFEDDRHYGRFSVDGVKWRAHRLAWFLSTGIDPGELLIRHTACENPPCCNPAHLAPGTDKDNSQDAIRHGRVQSGDRHWSRRHPEWIRRFVRARLSS